ncbi:uncharacterized protein AB675_11976 [Cyphellophora attinorum]|uniref:E3 ubiquitin-protein ligase CCNB1IP1 n=1 Tax=Cyphellophora attinorum TaxID=1664694 RepID=A0A0N1H712_9EURO|nr:uncharacterized protein AB675_11976 [Phialophora attinorum]KPI38276.1 hypothetical protein AB675_11976 [Phialophora attinorum]
MDCASRALAFWTYQTTQEIFYQEHLGKILKDKYGQLSAAMDKIINEANTEISTLQDKINNFSIDQRTLQDKYDDLANLYREKSKKAAQAQQLYDALKKKVLMRRVETAASADANQTLQSIDARGALPTHQDQQPMMERHQPHFDPPERHIREHEQDGHHASAINSTVTLRIGAVILAALVTPWDHHLGRQRDDSVKVRQSWALPCNAPLCHLRQEGLRIDLRSQSVLRDKTLGHIPPRCTMVKSIDTAWADVSRTHVPVLARPVDMECLEA